MIFWLLGVRGFYDFALGAPLPPAYLAQTVLPLVLVAVAVYGAVKVRWAILVLPFVAVVVLQALAADRLGCSYCVQRSVFALEPVLAAGVGLGLVALWRTRGTGLRVRRRADGRHRRSRGPGDDRGRHLPTRPAWGGVAPGSGADRRRAR